MAAPDPVSLALADELRTRREEKGLTQQQMADAIPMRRSVYQRLEYCERRCSVPQLEAIGKVLGVKGSQILATAEDRAAAGNYPRLSPGAVRLRGTFGIDP